jgi:hypothetical protein
MSFAHLPREAQIHLVDTAFESQLHCRYEMIEVPAHTPRIITTNLLPSEIFSWEHEAIRRRITTWEVVTNKNKTKTRITNINAYHDGATSSK